MTPLVEKMQTRFHFFGALTEQEVLDFLRFCDTRSVPAGKLLWREGEAENYTAFIVSGRIGIKKKTEFEKEQVIIGLYGVGSVVGELCLLTDNVRSVTAEALEASELVILESSRFEQLLSEQPILGLKLLKHIFLTTCRRLRKSYDRIASIF